LDYWLHWLLPGEKGFLGMAIVRGKGKERKGNVWNEKDRAKKGKRYRERRPASLSSFWDEVSYQFSHDRHRDDDDYDGLL
jgi:hypothetical protein